jgi:hypothetical protein
MTKTVQALEFPGVVGDGRNDDTAGLQAALDSGAATVVLSAPPAHYLISRALAIHSGQTLAADRNAVIRLADHAHAHLLTNADHEQGNHHITVTGGIWDGNNAHQTCLYHQNGGDWQVPFDPQSYQGVLMQFNRVTDLRVAHLTLKDPEMFGFQAGNLRRFTIEDITFDYNMLRGNMDGIHLHGNSHEGRIVNLKGATNDDLVALNADDGSIAEMSRGPITDILVDGVWAQDGYTAVRLLSAGSPIRRIKLANIFGTYRYNVVSFTNHQVHPGEPSTFDDISIQGVFCAKSTLGMEPAALAGFGAILAPIWIDAPAVVSSLTLRDYHRTEERHPVADIEIEPGATVKNLVLSDVVVKNRCAAPMHLLHNRGTVENLSLVNVLATAAGAGAGSAVVKNDGTLHRSSHFGVVATGYEAGPA